MTNDSDELKEALDLETWLQNEGVSFRVVQGSRGRQFNCLECPACGARDSLHGSVPNVRYRQSMNARV
jgi:hypothetical protein